MKGLSSFDATHGLLTTYAYQLPGAWLRGWTLSGTTLFRSGTPFDVEVGTDGPPLGNVDGKDGIATVLDPTILGRAVNNPDTSLAILRRSAFSIDRDMYLKGRGNIGRNTFRKDGIANFNVALARSFTLPEPALPVKRSVLSAEFTPSRCAAIQSGITFVRPDHEHLEIAVTFKFVLAVRF